MFCFVKESRHFLNKTKQKNNMRKKEHTKNHTITLKQEATMIMQHLKLLINGRYDFVL